jgi:hypothetical protein
MDALKHRFAFARALCAVALALFFVCPQFALAASDAAVQVAERLRAIAGTAESVTFWSGGTAERPEYTWTFSGQDIAREQAASLVSLDLGISVSAEDADNTGAPDTLALDFAHDGALPAPALVSVALPEDFDAAGSLALFSFDEQTGAYTELQRGFPVEDGYVSFYLTYCSRLTLSTVDLALPASQRTESPAGSTDALPTSSTEIEPTASPEAASADQQSAFLGIPLPVLIVAPLLVVSAFVAILVVRRRRRAELAIMQQGWNTSELVFEDIPSIDELLDIEEPDR